MKTKIKAVLFVLFTAMMMAVPGGIAVATDAEGQYTVYGIYGHELSCSRFLEKDKQFYRNVEGRLAKASLAHDAWVSGFLSAAGLYNDTQRPFDYDANLFGIRNLLREYCEKNPLDSLADAATNIAEQLIN